ncbi:hypothetical protein DJ94_3639 [Bacillus pseudomycoides]|nr:hypothetical protein DJ94_3639 [Bacillus pseudomycoides]
MNAFISVVTNGSTPPKNVKTAIAIAIIISSFLILRYYESLYSYYSKLLLKYQYILIYNITSKNHVLYCFLQHFPMN